MNDRIPELIILLSAAALFFAWRWWTLWRVVQLRKSLAQTLADLEKQPPPLDPESGFIIRLSTDSVSCTRPDGKVESVAWDDLQRVEILTTADGPLSPDVFWVLHGTTSGCVIPWDATGSDELLKRLQQLPEFDNQAVIDGSSKTEDGVRLCWHRSPEHDQG